MFLVTGATGHVGSALVARLAASGRPVRALARHASAARWPAGVEPIDADLAALASRDLARGEAGEGDGRARGAAHPDGAERGRAAVRAALAGVEAIFLFTPPSPGGAGDLARLAREAGVRRGVLLSSIATQKADPRVNPIAARHAAAEQALQDSGLPATILRPDTFASNALDWAPAIRAGGPLRLPHPDSRRVPIHEADLAEAAFLAMTEAGHEGQAWWLTGPGQVSQAEQVQAIAEAIGRPLAVEELPETEALAQWSARMPQAAAQRLMDYLRKSIAHPPPVSPDLARVLGRPGRDFGDWARDHRGDFRA